MEIFPWLEDELAAYNTRHKQNTRNTDIALSNFLNVLSWFRTVLLQDLAILSGAYPNLSILSFHPFCLPAFTSWAEDFRMKCTEIETANSESLACIPERFAAGVRASIASLRSDFAANFAGSFSQLNVKIDNLSEKVQQNLLVFPDIPSRTRLLLEPAHLRHHSGSKPSGSAPLGLASGPAPPPLSSQIHALPVSTLSSPPTPSLPMCEESHDLGACYPLGQKAF